MTAARVAFILGNPREPRKHKAVFRLAEVDRLRAAVIIAASV